MIRLSRDTDFMNKVGNELETGNVGLIVLDIVDYAGLERSMGRPFCDKLVREALRILEKVMLESSPILALRIQAYDLLLFVRLPNRDPSLAQYRLRELTSEYKALLADKLQEQFGGGLKLEVYAGYSLFNEIPNMPIDHMFYYAMKQSIRRVSQPANLDENRSKWNEFHSIILDRNITSVYQPIVSLGDAQIFGFEALTRGPADSEFHSPLHLFEYAESRGALYSLDRLAREKAIEGCGQLKKNQRVFINIPAHVIDDPQFTSGMTMKIVERCGLDPHNVVLEITERTSIEDFSTAKRILEHYRSQGYQIAIDDAGAGYSSLQAIAELHPDFIKVDRSLVQNIHNDKMKEMILETFVSFARKMSIRIIAEGIEEWEELKKLAQMGVHFGQGFLLGRPVPQLVNLQNEVASQIESINRLQGMEGISQIGNMAAPICCFDQSAPISQAANYFKDNEDAAGAVILNGQQPVGLIMREKLFQQLAGQYGISLYWNRPLAHLMDPNPLIVEETVPVEQVSQMATSREKTKLYDLVIITSKQKMLGVASIQTLLEAITSERLENARVANPLTGLPGNTQIKREMNKRMIDGTGFSVIYADLDYFKWFNDRYGFQKGDQMIQFTADVLQQAVSVCGHPHDFVGHIGGDDLIVISGTEHPERLCQEIIRRFDQGVRLFYADSEWTYAEDRQGNRIESGGVTVSLSLVECGKGNFATLERISQTAAALKKKAKARAGSSYASERLEAASAN